MLSFPKLNHTPEGVALIAKNLAGASLKFTYLRLFNGSLMVAELLSESKQHYEKTDRVLLNFALPTQETQSIAFDRVELYALDPDAGEILYSANSVAAPLELVTVYPQVIPVRTAVGDASNVTVIIADFPAEDFCTWIAFYEHTYDYGNPHRVTAEQIGAASQDDFYAHVQDKDNPHEVKQEQVIGLQGMLDELSDWGNFIRNGVDLDIITAMGRTI